MVVLSRRKQLRSLAQRCLPLASPQPSHTPSTFTAPACTCCLQWPQASESQVAAAEALVQSLLMPDFESASIQNPALQRHFQVGGWAGLGGGRVGGRVAGVMAWVAGMVWV